MTNNRGRKLVKYLSNELKWMESPEFPVDCDLCHRLLYAERKQYAYGAYSEHPVDWIQLKCHEHNIRYQLFIAVGSKVRGIDV